MAESADHVPLLSSVFDRRCKYQEAPFSNCMHVYKCIRIPPAFGCWLFVPSLHMCCVLLPTPGVSCSCNPAALVDLSGLQDMGPGAPSLSEQDSGAERERLLPVFFRGIPAVLSRSGSAVREIHGPWGVQQSLTVRDGARGRVGTT